MTIKPRYYQREAVDAMHKSLVEENVNGLVVIGTGGGKSYTMCAFLREQIAAIPDLRILIVTDTKELLTQIFRSVVNYWPAAPVGLYSAGLGQRKGRSQITIGGIQSIYNKAGRDLSDFDLVLIDECQMVGKKSESMYGRLIQDMMLRVPHLRIYGLTATPYRLDSGRLDEGDPRLFDRIIYKKDAGDLIHEGWLAMPISKRTETQIDLSSVKKSGHEFNQKELEEAADRITAQACIEMADRSVDRKSWLVFAAGVEHAHHVRDCLQTMHIGAEVIHGGLGASERDGILRAHKEGHFRALINVAILTKGFDSPGIDMIAMLRSTASLGLFQQIVGRGLRPVWPRGFDPNEASIEERIAAQMGGEKPNFSFLDYGGNLSRHGPIDDPFIREKGARSSDAGGQVAPSKLCPTCEAFVSIQTRTCPDCNHEWQFEAKARHEEEASDAPIMSNGVKAPVSDTQWFTVDKLLLELWRKPEKPPSIRVTYRLPEGSRGSVSEWLTFESQYGMPRSTRDFLSEVLPGRDRPQTASEALAMIGDMRPITSVAVRKPKKGEKYHEIRGRRAVDVDPLPAMAFLCEACHTMVPQHDRCVCESGLSFKAKQDEHLESAIDWMDDDIPF